MNGGAGTRMRAPAVGAVLIVGALAVAVALLTLTLSVQHTVSFCLVLFAAAGVFDYAVRRDVLSPVVILAVIFSWLYVAKADYILQYQVLSSGTIADQVLVDDGWRRALQIALVAACVTFVAIAVACTIAQQGRSRPVTVAARVERPARLFRKSHFQLFAGAALAVDLAAFALLISAGGGLHSYLDGLALRSSSLVGVSFLTLGLVPLNIALFIGVAARYLAPESQRPDRAILIALFVASLVSSLLTGGRAAVLTQCVLPVAIVVNYARRRIRAWTAAALGAGGVVAFVVLGVVLRDSQFQKGSGGSVGQLIADRFHDLRDSLVGGVEAVPLDSLVQLIGAQRINDFTYLHGATYAPILTWPIPRALWAGKPAGGGNAWFTSTYVPRFYGPNKVESSISFIGESFTNFGWVGIVVLSLLLGWAVGVVYRRMATARDIYLLGLYATLFGYFLALIRGDAYHNVTSAVFAIVVWRVAAGFLGFSRRVDDDGATGRRPAPTPHLHPTPRAAS
jgi:hypothetical protein